MITTRLCVRRFTSSEARNLFQTDVLQWEDISPPSESTSTQISDATEDCEALEEMRPQRFYVPPPFSDERLKQATSEEISEWPKSRIVWALGRVGYVADLRVFGSSVPQLLLQRAESLESSLNTRDIIRILQAVSYIPDLSEPGIIQRLRKAVCNRIDSVSDLFLISLIYGHVKLVGRVDWTVTPNCNKTTQFLISELIHRKSKIDGVRFLEVTSSLLTNPRILTSHNDSVQMVLRHACEVSLKHAKVIRALVSFGKALCGIPNQHLFASVNQILEHKFSKDWRSANDALRAGFFFLMADLMSVKTVIAWLRAVMSANSPLSIDHDRISAENKQMVHISKLLLQQRNQSDIIPEKISKWIQSVPSHEFTSSSIEFGSGRKSEPLIGVESLHVGSVLRRMISATVESGLGSIFVSPFHLSACNLESKIHLEWVDQAELEPPHRRGLARVISKVRREYLAKSGWTLIALNRSDFKYENDFARVNEKFKESVKIPGVVWKDQVGVATSDRKTIQITPHEERLEGSREKREARSRAWRMKSQLKSISKQFHRKRKHNT